MKWFSNLQVPDVKGLLVDVDGIRPRSETPHGGQVTAVAPHGLDDEDPPLGAAGRLFDAVTRLNDRGQWVQDRDGKRTINQKDGTLERFKYE